MFSGSGSGSGYRQFYTCLQLRLRFAIHIPLQSLPFLSRGDYRFPALAHPPGTAVCFLFAAAYVCRMLIELDDRSWGMMEAGTPWIEIWVK